MTAPTRNGGLIARATGIRRADSPHTEEGDA